MTVFVMLPSSVSSLSDWILFFISRDNLQIIRAFVLGVSPTHQDFTMGAPPTFFRADSVTLNTPHTTGKSDKIIFRTTKIIGTLPRIVGRGKISTPDYLVVCTQRKRVLLMSAPYLYKRHLVARNLADL